MKNLKISKKLLVTFGIIMAMFLITVAASIFGLIYGGNLFEDFYGYSYPISNRTLQIRAELQTAIKSLGLSMLTNDKQLTEEYIRETDEQVVELRKNFEYLQKTYRGDVTRINQTLALIDGAEECRVRIQEFARNNNSEAEDLFFNEYSPAMLEAIDMVVAMDENTTSLANTTYDSAQKAQNFVTFLALGISVVALLITVTIARYLTKSLTRPIFEIEEVANEMAQGHLNVTLTYQSRDELGSLSESMRTMSSRIDDYMKKINTALSQLADGDLNVAHQEDFLGDFHFVQLAVRKLAGSLNSTLSQINQSADQVSAGSDQVSSGSQALSQGATEQASSIEELAATVNEISHQIQATAGNTREALLQTNNASTEIGVCNQQMQNMIVAMDDISGRSSEIGKIIKTIEDIAFQTNILALNAAVEAARAGAAGKGFAVVADEVRNLASKSAEASKNTASLIEGTVSAVANGTEIANITAKSLVKVVSSAQSVAAIVDRISEAAGKQADSVGQVTHSIEQISSVVQTNSATAEESAAASEELSGQAQMLKSLISQFKLWDNGDTKKAFSVSIPAEATAPSFEGGKY